VYTFPDIGFFTKRTATHTEIAMQSSSIAHFLKLHDNSMKEAYDTYETAVPHNKRYAIGKSPFKPRVDCVFSAIRRIVMLDMTLIITSKTYRDRRQLND
jgi:hypothetical protein